jgi:GEVED domain
MLTKLFNAKNYLTPRSRQNGLSKMVLRITMMCGLLVPSLSGLMAQVTVQATSGVASANYATVSAAFAAINSGTHQGAVTILVTGNTAEPGAPVALLKSASPSNYSSVYLRPQGGNWTIAGTITGSRGIIELSGADNVTIDGDDPNTAGARNLTIGFASTAATITACVRISSNSTSGADGANNNTVKNCILIGNRSGGSTTATYGINMSNYSTSSLGAGGYSSLNNTFENNLITRVYHGIWASGTSSTYPNKGTIIRNNVLGDNTTANNIGARGILISNSSIANGDGNALISGNEIMVGDPGTTGLSASIYGIEVGTGNKDIIIERNYIHDVVNQSASGYGAHGIYISGISDNIRIRNNIIRDMKASRYSTTTFSSQNSGVYFSSGATGIKMDNNTIVLSQTNTTGTQAAYVSPCVYATSSAVFSSFQNNILVNSQNTTGAFGFYSLGTGNISSATVNRNDYYVSVGNIGYYNAANRTTLAAWQTATSKDANSLNINPVFTSATDLHLSYGTTGSQFESGGAILSDYNVDYDNQARPGPAGSLNGGGTSYDIGADEFDGVPLTAVTIASVTNVTGPACTASSNIVNATVVGGSYPVTSVSLNFSINGVAQTAIPMSNVGGNTWAATLPDASTVINTATGLPFATNSNITWSVTAIDPLANITMAGTPFQNDITFGITANVNASAASVCSGTVATLSVALSNISTTTQPSYATPTNTSTLYHELTNVTINQGTSTIFNNESAVNSLSGTIGNGTGVAGCYSNFASLATYNMTAGQQYSFSLSVNQNGSTSGSAVAIFIDYDRNGVFSNAEMAYTSSALTTNAYVQTGNFTIPYTAFNGLARMRVVVNYNALISASTVVTYGEYEDYLLNISSAANGGGASLPVISAITWYDTNLNAVATANNASVYPVNTETYTAEVLVQGCSILSNNTVTVVANPLPTAPTGLSSTQCGPLVPTASVVSNSGATNPLFTWNQNPYNSAFTNGASGSLGETLYGNASYLNGAVQLTPNAASNIGAMMIPANGVQGTDYSIAFSLKTSLAAQSGADGMSYCFGDDATWPLTLNAEYGSGSKLHVSFDSYGTSGDNIAGIRVIYGASTNTPGQIIGTNGVLAYSNNVSWAGTTNNVPVVVNITNGNLTLTVNGTAIFTNLALPASFVSADKSNWKHLFAARTGGVSMIHTIDDVTITPALAGATSSATTYTNLINSTTTFYVTETSNGCVSQAVPVTVTVNPPPAVTIAGNNNLCIGQSTTLTATSANPTYSYTWSTSPTTAAIDVAPTTATTYTVTAIDNDTTSANYTCNTSASVVVNVNALPPVTVSPSTSTVCAGASQTLTMALSGPQTVPTGYCTGAPSTTTFGDEQIFGVTFGSMSNIQTETCTTNYTDYSSSIPTVTYMVGTAYPFSVITDECNGPTYYSSGLSIFIDYNRDGDFDDAGEQAYTTTATTISPNTRTGSITIPANATVGVTRMRVVVIENVVSPTACPTFSYGEMEDYKIDIQYAIPASPQISWNSGETTSSISAAPTATSTYTVTYTDANGCVNTANATVNLTTLTAFDGIVTNPTCFGANGSIEVVASGGLTPYTYSIDGVNYVTSSTIAAPAGSYTVYVKDASGCVASHSGVVVTEPTQVQITNVLGTNPICNGYTNGQLTFDVNGGTGLLAATVNGASATSPVTNLAAGSYTIVVTDASGCTATSSIVLVDPAIPTLAISNNGPVCNGSLVTLTPTTGFVTYSWTGPNNFTASTENPQVSLGGTYSLTAVDANGCSATLTNEVVVNPILPVSVSLATTPATSVCVGTDMTITATPVNGGLNPIYVWTLDGVTQSSTTNTLQFVSSNTTIVSVQLTSDEVCTSGNPATASETITVTGAINATVALTSSNTAPCVGDVLTYTTSTVGGGTAPTFEFFVNNVSVQNGSLSTYTYAPVNGDVVSVVMTSSFACAIGSPATSNSITQLVNALPSAPVLTASALAVCSPSTIEVSADVTTGLNWSNNTTSSSVIVSSVGPQLLTATYTDANGCISAPALPIVVTIYPQNITAISATNNANLCPGSAVTLTSSSASNNVWSTGDVTSTISASTAGQYSLTNVDANGCMSVSDVTVIEQPAPVVNVVSNCSVLLNGNSITFDATASIATGNIATYAWQSGATVVSSTASLTTSTGGVYILNVTSDQGCSTLTPVLADITSPLAGIYTIGGTASCSNFTSFANAFAAINTRGVAGNVTFEVASDYTETAPVGGLTMSQCNLAANLMSGPLQTISFVKVGSGANPKINAPLGTTAGSTNTYTDNIVKIVGSDNVTFNGIDLFDGNTTANGYMESGLSVYKCGTTNGSNDIVFTNGLITLNRANTNAIGVRVSNTNGSNTTALVYSGADTQSGVQAFRNKVSITNSTITNTYGAIYFDAATAATTSGISTNDTLNTVSGLTVTNFGGSSTAVYAIRYNNNRGIQVSNNNVNSLGAGHTGIVYAINGGNGPHGDISGNTVNVNAPSTFYGIYWSASGLNNAASVANNNVVNSVLSSTSTYYGFFIGLSGTNSNAVVSGNTVSGLTSTAGRTSGTTYGIYYSSTTTSASVINNTFTNNNIGAPTYSGTSYGIYYSNSSQPASSMCSVTNNAITNNTFNGTGIATQLYVGGSSLSGIAPGSASLNVNNNQISGNTKTGTGTMSGIYSVASGAGFNPTMQSNVVSNNTVVGGAGSCSFMALDFSSTSSTTGASWNVINNTLQNNNITSVTGANAATLAGINYQHQLGGVNPTFANNTIKDMSLGGSSTGTQNIYGVYVNGVANNNHVISSNTIHNLSSTSTGNTNIIGIYNGTSNLASVAANKVAGLSAVNGVNSTVFGVSVGGGATATIANNIVGSLTATAATGANAMRGINVGGGTTINVYFNTIHLSGSTSGGSTGIDMSASPTSIVIKNNIVSNTMTAGAGKLAVALRRVNSTATNYALSSNSNLFNVTNSGTNALYTDGTTTHLTLAALQAALTPRESVSNLEDITTSFASILSQDVNFLHLNAGAATVAESGAESIPSILTDFDGDTRSGNPDIGADEFAGSSVVPTITSIVTNLSGNQCIAIGRDVTATVQSANPVTAVMLNYAFNGVAQTPISMVNSVNNDWIASIPVANPANATVTWSVMVSNGTYNTLQSGITYADEPNNGLGLVLTASASNSTVCAGSPSTLSVTLATTAQNTATYCVPVTTTNTTYGIATFTAAGSISNISNTSGSTPSQSVANFTSQQVAQSHNGSVSVSFQGIGTGTYGFAAWVDWNKNGSFEVTERMFNTSSYTNNTTGSFVVPSTAVVGQTRMRVIGHYSSSNPADPCLSTSSSFEYEDYTFIVLPSITSYAWSTGATSATEIVNPIATSTYSCVATINGCPVSSSAVTVNVNVLPAAPIDASISPACATDATYSVTSAVANPIYKWYATPTSSAVPNASASSYTQAAANGNGATNTFYASVVDANGCESPQTPCFVVLNTPASISVSSAQVICVGQSAVVSVSSANGAYSYAWNTNETTQSITVSPITTSNFVVTATDTTGAAVCTASASVQVTVNQLPVISAAMATPSVVCSGDSVALFAAMYENGPQTQPTGYCTGSPSTTTADEQIFGVSFASMSNIQAETCSSNYTNYTSSLAPIQVVRGNTYPFSVITDECDGSTYFSSGMSIFIDYNRDGDFSDAGEQVYTTTATTLSPNTRSGNILIPTSASTGLTRMRVVVIEGVASPTACPSFSYGEMEDYLVNIQGLSVTPYNFAWNTTPVTNSQSASTLSASVLTSNTSGLPEIVSNTVTVTNPATGCENTQTVSFTVNPVPTAPIVSNVANICGMGVSNATVASTTNASQPNISWYTNSSLTSPVLSSSYNGTPMTTYYLNDYASSVGSATLTGSATLSNGLVQLTPATNSQIGGMTILGSGVDADKREISFTIQTSAAANLGADGMSYSFAPDASATSSPYNAEVGTGTKLKISFDEYDAANTASGQGIRVIYGPSQNGPGVTPGVNGVLAYSTNVTWAGSGANDVVVSISELGKLTLSLNGVSIFTDLQLPASYLTDIKSNWKHVFMARTGGVNNIHSVDNVSIKEGTYSGSALSNPTAISSTTTYYVTETAYGCESTASSFTVQVDPAPSLSMSVSNDTICSGSSVALSVSSANPNYVYTWANGLGTGSTINVSPSVTTNYIVVAVDTTSNSPSYGCSIQDTITVVVNALPTISVSPATAAICVGGLQQLTMTSGSVWTTVNGLFTDASGTTPAVGTETTVYAIPSSSVTYTASLTDANGCTSTASSVLTVNPIPVVEVSLSANNVCGGTPVTLTATGANTYVWTPGNLSGSSVIVSPNTTTTYTVAGYGQGNCSASASITLNINATPLTPVLTSAGSTTICDGSSVVLSTTSTEGLQWFLNGVAISGATASSYTATAAGSYTLTSTSTSGCTSALSNSISVVVNTVPTVIASSNATNNTICKEELVTLTASGAATFSWTNGVSSGVAFPALATTTYTVTGTTLAGCSSTASVTVVVNPLPDLIVSGATTVCSGSTAILTASGDADAYVWNPGNISGALASVSPTVTTSYTVTATISATGCQSQETVTVTVTQPTTPTFTQVAAICSGASLSALPTTSNNGVDGTWSPTLNNTATTTYTFTPAAGSCANTATMDIVVNTLPTVVASASASSINLGSSVDLTASGANTYAWDNSSTTAVITVSPTATTTYQVTGTSLEGCTGTGSVTVTVNACPTVEVSASASTICEGSSTVLTATGADTYVWNNGSTGSSITVNPTTTSTYIVSGTSNGCTINDTVEIVVNQLAAPMFTQVAAICSGATLTALPTTSNNGIDGTWSPALDNTATTTYTFTPATGSCANTTTMEIIVNSLPTISVIASPEFICSGSSSTLNATGAATYLWNNGSTTSSITVTPNTTSTYSLVGTDANGCQSTASVTVTVDQPVIPAFTQVAEICTGAALSALPTTSSNGIDGTWSPALDNTTTTTYTFTPAVGACATGATMQIVVNALPTVTASAASATICSGASVVLTASGASTYAWDNGSTGSSITVSPTAAATYTVTGTNASGCTATATVSVGVISAPVITSPTTVSCSGAAVVLTSSLTSGVQWYKTGVLISGATSATYSATTAGTYTVKPTACTSLVSNGIAITTGSNPSAPSAVVQSGNLLLCGPSAQVVLQSTVAPSGTTGVQWYVDGSAIAGATAQTYTTSTPGSYVVRRVQLASGCTSTASTALAVVAGTVPSTPVASVQSGALALCSGATSTLASDVLPSASVSLQWYKDGVAQSAATAATLVADAAGSYTVKATDLSGCASALSNAVALTAVPTAVISSPSLAVCNGTAITLTSNVTSDIQWYKTGVLISGATSATYSATTAGTYTVKSTLCPLQVSNSLAVITGLAPAAPTATSPIGTVVCSSSPITLQSSIAPSGTNSLQWYKDGAAISGATLQTYSTAVVGAYTVRRIQVSSGCPSVASNAVSVTNGGFTPAATTASGSTYICSSTTNNVVLSSAAAPSASTGLQWYNGSTAIAGATAQTYTASVAGVYSVKRVTSTGCASASSNALTVIVGSIPSTTTISASGNNTVVCGTTAVTLSSLVGPTTSATLQWYKDGVAMTNITSQVVPTTLPGVYTVRRISYCPSLPSNAITVTTGTVPSAPVVSVQSGSLATCYGTPVVLGSDVAPGSGTTLQWYKSSTLLSNATAQSYSTATAGSYRVKATSGGCTSPFSNSLSVSVISIPGTASISVYSGSLTLCNGSSVTLKSLHTVTNNIGIRWFKDGVEIAGATSQFYTTTTPGVYTARRINSSGCLGAASSALTVISCNPIVVNDNNEEQEDATSKLNEELTWDAAVSRNPYDQYVTIRLNTASDSDVELTMVDAMGKVVSTDYASMKELGSLHIGEGLTPGMYLIQVRQDDNIKTIRVIKQ